MSLLPPAAYFGAYEALKGALARWQGIPVSELGPMSLMTAGGVGGAAFWIICYPADVSRWLDGWLADWLAGLRRARHSRRGWLPEAAHCAHWIVSLC